MPTIAERLFDAHNAECEMETQLEDAGIPFDHIGWDWYDCSIELYKVGKDVRLDERQQKIIFDAGFAIAFVNHEDGWETHYSWDHKEPFKRKRGWRRRYVSDPNAETTNVVAGDPNPGYYEISYWPEGWNTPITATWKENGYMRIVSDPFDPGD